jgi:hypothetical protein
MRNKPAEKLGDAGRLGRLLAHEGNLQQQLAATGDVFEQVVLLRRLLRVSRNIRGILQAANG